MTGEDSANEWRAREGAGEICGDFGTSACACAKREEAYRFKVICDGIPRGRSANFSSVTRCGVKPCGFLLRYLLDSSRRAQSGVCNS